MPIRTASDLVYSVIAWLPLVAIVSAVIWVLGAGVMNLEQRSFGSEFFLGNHASTNAPESVGPTDEELLAEALNSGDTHQMALALDQVG